MLDTLAAGSPRVRVVPDAVTAVKIVDAAGVEVPGLARTTDQDNTILFLRGYDRFGNAARTVGGTWSVSGGIGFLTDSTASSRRLVCTTVGSGKVYADSGAWHDSTSQILVVTHGAYASSRRRRHPPGSRGSLRRERRGARRGWEPGHHRPRLHGRGPFRGLRRLARAGPCRSLVHEPERDALGRVVERDATARRAGTFFIAARDTVTGLESSPRRRLEVDPAAPNRIELRPDTLRLVAGEPDTMTIVAYDVFGNRAPIPAGAGEEITLWTDRPRGASRTSRGRRSSRSRYPRDATRRTFGSATRRDGGGRAGRGRSTRTARRRPWARRARRSSPPPRRRPGRSRSRRRRHSLVADGADSAGVPSGVVRDAFGKRRRGGRAVHRDRHGRVGDHRYRPGHAGSPVDGGRAAHWQGGCGPARPRERLGRTSPPCAEPPRDRGARARRGRARGRDRPRRGSRLPGGRRISRRDHHGVGARRRVRESGDGRRALHRVDHPRLDRHAGRGRGTPGVQVRASAADDRLRPPRRSGARNRERLGGVGARLLLRQRRACGWSRARSRFLSVHGLVAGGGRRAGSTVRSRCGTARDIRSPESRAIRSRYLQPACRSSQAPLSPRRTPRVDLVLGDGDATGTASLSVTIARGPPRVGARSCSSTARSTRCRDRTGGAAHRGGARLDHGRGAGRLRKLHARPERPGARDRHRGRGGGASRGRGAERRTRGDPLHPDGGLAPRDRGRRRLGAPRAGDPSRWPRAPPWNLAADSPASTTVPAGARHRSARGFDAFGNASPGDTVVAPSVAGGGGSVAFPVGGDGRRGGRGLHAARGRHAGNRDVPARGHRQRRDGRRPLRLGLDRGRPGHGRFDLGRGRRCRHRGERSST